FQELMRAALQIVPVLERARLALVTVDRHEPRAWLCAHEAPLAARWKSRTAEPAQAAIRKRRNHVLDGALAREASLEHLVTAFGAIGLEVLIGRNVRMRVSG